MANAGAQERIHATNRSTQAQTGRLIRQDASVASKKGGEKYENVVKYLSPEENVPNVEKMIKIMGE